MKKWNLTLKSIAVIVMVALVWSCSSNDDELPIEDEDDGDPVGTVYLDEKFDKMVWGGDYINQQTGIKGGFVRDQNNQWIIDENAPVVECTPGTDGSSDLFDTVSPSYKALRGISDWVGWKGYERPGYLKIGTSTTTDAFVGTPALSSINEETVNIKVSADLAIWANNSEIILVDVIGGGTVSTNELTVTHHDRWETYEFFVQNATPRTQVLFKSVPERGNGRFLIDNVLIVKVE